MSERHYYFSTVRLIYDITYLTTVIWFFPLSRLAFYFYFLQNDQQTIHIRKYKILWTICWADTNSDSKVCENFFSLQSYQTVQNITWLDHIAFYLLIKSIEDFSSFLKSRLMWQSPHLSIPSTNNQTWRRHWQSNVANVISNHPASEWTSERCWFTVMARLTLTALLRTTWQSVFLESFWNTTKVMWSYTRSAGGSLC